MAIILVHVQVASMVTWLLVLQVLNRIAVDIRSCHDHEVPEHM
jgi:hypothetical protein